MPLQSICQVSEKFRHVNCRFWHRSKIVMLIVVLSCQSVWPFASICQYLFFNSTILCLLNSTTWQFLGRIVLQFWLDSMADRQFLGLKARQLWHDSTTAQQFYQEITPPYSWQVHFSKSDKFSYQISQSQLHNWEIHRLKNLSPPFPQKNHHGSK